MNDPRLKDTNPKDALGMAKVPLGLLSPIAKAYWAAAQHLGKTKYGAWNWRACGVRASVYIDAAGRHLDAFNSGERVDPVDGTHHLGNVMACCAILLEAEARGNLIDDRPPVVSHRAAYAEVESVMVATVERYRDLKPRHYAIADALPIVGEQDASGVIYTFEWTVANKRGRVVSRGFATSRTAAMEDADREAAKVKGARIEVRDILGEPFAEPEPKRRARRARKKTRR